MMNALVTIVCAVLAVNYLICGIPLKGQVYSRDYESRVFGVGAALCLWLAFGGVRFWSGF